MHVRKETEAEAAHTQDCFTVAIEQFMSRTGLDEVSSLYVFLDTSYTLLEHVDAEVARDIVKGLSDPKGHDTEKLFALFKDLVASYELKKMEHASDKT